ncbi:MAG: AAA family ATPase [Nitrososphaera sp.]
MRIACLLYPYWTLRQIQMVTGGSGVGKSTLIATWLKSLMDGTEIMGRTPEFTSTPLYISNERSQGEVNNSNQGDDEEVKGWGLTCPTISFRTAAKGTGKTTRNAGLLRQIIKKYSQKHRVIVIDPILTFCAQPNDQNKVHEFLDEIVEDALIPNDVTLIATAHEAKQREGNEIIGSRAKAAGSYGWGAFTSCHHNVKKYNKDPEDKRFVVEVTPRYAAEFKIFYNRVDHGTAVEIMDPATPAKDFLLEPLLARREFTTAEALLFGEGKKLSASSVARWLRDKKNRGMLREKARGVHEPILETKIPFRESNKEDEPK